MGANDPFGEILREANSMQKMGKNVGALKILKSALQKNPGNVQNLLALGLLYNQLGDYQKAVPALQQACHFDPQNEAILVPYSRALSGIGNFKDSQILAEASIHLKPKSIKVLENARDIFNAAGNKEGLVKCLERLCSLKPKGNSYYKGLSRIYWELHHYEKAHKTFKKYWDEDSANAHELAMASEFAYFARNINEAIGYIEKSLALDPNNSQNWAFLGSCYSVRGDKKEARKAFEEAVVGKPPFIGAYYRLAKIKNFQKGDPAFATLEGLKIKGDLKTGDASALGFSLGRMYNGTGEYDKAFENYQIGNAALRQHFAQNGNTFNRTEVEKEFKLVSALFSSRNREKIKHKGSESKKPIFIIGLPRSGTTLLEQIMAAHSEISSAGELNTLSTNFNEVMLCTNKLEETVRETAMLAVIDDKGEEFSANFLKILNEKGGKTSMIIDKLPQNFFQLGFINVLFPNAKIIHLKRDPMDIGLSIYCNWFSGSYNFSTNLGDIGFYIRQYRNLMADWNKTIELSILEVEYQALVENPEAVARGVIEFCGLEWQPDCLEYYKNRSSVFTASLMQVREPVYKSAIGKWKNYEKHLGPLKTALAEKV